MTEKTIRELIDALEAIEEDFGNLPVAVCSVTAEWNIVALHVAVDGKRAELQIVRSS